MDALIYGGVQIGRMNAKVATHYTGPFLQFHGSTFNREKQMYESAYISVDMSPKEAIDLAVMLLKSADLHGARTQAQAKAAIKRLAKRD